MLRDQHLYPPNIAETLAALQRGPESRQPGYSRYSLQVCANHAGRLKAVRSTSCRSACYSCLPRVLTLTAHEEHTECQDIAHGRHLVYLQDVSCTVGLHNQTVVPALCPMWGCKVMLHLQDDQMWQAHGGLMPYHESRNWAAADSIMRHLSDPVHSLRDTLQASGSLPNSMLHRWVH